MKQPLLASMFTVLLFTFVTGCCSYHPTPANPGNQINLTVLTTDVGLAPKVDLWVDEVLRRYTDAIIIDGHGNTEIIDGEEVWCLYTSLQWEGIPIVDVVRQIQAQDPGRHIVILCCNPDGLLLEGVTGVSYSLENVWVYPDAMFNEIENIQRDLYYVGCGDIFEFVEQ